MAEQKDMCSSPPGRASKSKLAVEQPSTEGHWNLPKKDTPCPKTKKKWQEMVGGAHHDKIKSYTHLVGNPQSGEQ